MGEFRSTPTKISSCLLTATPSSPWASTPPELTVRPLSFPAIQLISTGALRATSNRGLQPAMDYLFQHEADPLPDPNAPQTSQPSAAIDADDDEDLDPLGNIDAEAKVLAALPWCPTRSSLSCLEHQMFRVREGIQKHGASQLSCREDWP